VAIFGQPSILRNLICPLATRLKSSTTAASSLGREPCVLPGIPPTGKRVQVPLVVVVHFREGKLAHEHIYWDQASVLVQLGLIDPKTLPARS